MVQKFGNYYEKGTQKITRQQMKRSKIQYENEDKRRIILIF